MEEYAGTKPNLKLIFEKGPRKGETLECPNESNVRIGRIIKGNTFTIKDPAISQNHLRIQCDGSDWSVTDLDTSNGTIVNGEKLQSNTPFRLGDGDNIKIGATTSITVLIEKIIDPVVPEKPRRNTKRQARGRGVKKNETSSSQSDLNFEAASDADDERIHIRDSGVEKRLNSAAFEVKESANLDFAQPRRNPRRRAALGVASHGNLKNDGLLLEKATGPRGENASISAKVEDRSEILPAAPRVSRRRAAAKAVCEEALPLEKNSNVVSEITSTSANGEDRLEILPVPRDSRNQLAVKAVCEDKSATMFSNLVLEDPRELEEGGSCAAVTQNAPKGGDSGPADKKNGLENITLGEWFDRMEKYLPTKVNEAAEEIIASLRERQKRFEEFIREHRGNTNG